MECAALPEKKQIPIDFQLSFSRGIRLLKEGDEAGAELAFDKCAKACPEAWLGVASEDLRDGFREQAAKRFQQVITHATHNRTKAVALNNLGMLLNNNGARAEAQGLFELAYNLWKKGDMATNLALSHMYHHRMAEAKHWIKKAILMEPTNETIRFNSGLINLISGDLEQGFIDYESRFKKPVGKTKKLCVFRPEWNGQSIKDKTLLIYAEQGAGDTIQMLRYGPLIKPLVGKLHLATQKGLGGLAHRQGCWDKIYEDLPELIDSARVPHWDMQLPMMSLPRVMKTSLQTIPKAPYLTFPTHQLKRYGCLTIGFCWAGSLSHTDDVWRSTHIEEWADLFQISGTKFFSFQIGPRTIDLIDSHYLIVDLSKQIKDYDDSAAWIERMDIVICVDTSLAHLAGALGKIVWLLVPFSPDWRWMHDREDSPWYPSMRLFRQTKERDWSDVFQRIKQELTNAIQSAGIHPLGDDVRKLA